MNEIENVIAKLQEQVTKNEWVASEIFFMLKDMNPEREFSSIGAGWMKALYLKVRGLIVEHNELVERVKNSEP